MKQTLQKDFLLILGFFVLFVPIMFAGLFRIEYSFTAPGYNNEVEGFIELEEEYSQKGSIHTTSVLVVDRITILQRLLGSLNKKIEVSEIPTYQQNIDPDVYTQSGYLQKAASIQNSLIVASLFTDHPIQYDTSPTVYLTYSYLEENTLEVGDKVISINGMTDYKTALATQACGEDLLFEIDRDGEIHTFTVSIKPAYDCTIGLFIRNHTEITQTDLEYRIISTNTGGGSGGLMQTLYIYNRLTSFDITHGLRIAGTGTIDLNGDVGPIGGIGQKIYTAYYNDIDIFFVPHLSDGENDNYINALEIYETLNTDMLLVPVATFEEALTFLLTYEGGN